MADHADVDTNVDTQRLASASSAESSAESSWLVDGRYRILARLGSGGTADVFRANDEVLQRDVAVKIFRTAVVDLDGHGAQRRKLELQALARLSHPNLITLYDGSVSSDGPPYLVLELVPGADLATRLHDGPLPEAEVRCIGAQLADALFYAHGHGMVHRDVKPANVLLGSDGQDGEPRARLSDFGTVRLVDAARMTAVDLTLGTASYLAPEQMHGSDVGPAADIYALGLVLLEALTGRRCFDGGTVHEILSVRTTSTPEIPDDLPDPWPVLLAAMTATDPEARPSGAEVAASLQPVIAPTGWAVTPADAATPMEGTAPPLVALAPADAALPPADAALPSAAAALPPVEEAAPADAATHRRGRVAWFALAAIALLSIAAGVALLFRGGNGHAPTKVPPALPSAQHSASTSHQLPPVNATAVDRSLARAPSTGLDSPRTSAAARSTPVRGPGGAASSSAPPPSSSASRAASSAASSSTVASTSPTSTPTTSSPTPTPPPSTSPPPTATP